MKVFHVSSHGAFAGDGEGGADKAAVSSFIKDEKTWRKKLGNDCAYADPKAKPVVNSAKLAAYVAGKMRGKTKYQRQMESHNERRTKKPERGLGATVNRRIHLLNEEKQDHSEHKYGCRRIPNFKGWYAWRFEREEPGIMYSRRRWCVCTECAELKWGMCKLSNVEGGPGPWQRLQLHFVDRGEQKIRTARQVSDAVFVSSLANNGFVGVIDREGTNMDCLYRIAQIVVKPYTRDGARGGARYIDISWWTRAQRCMHRYEDSGEAVQTIDAADIIPVTVQWGRSYQGARAAGQRQGGEESVTGVSAQAARDKAVETQKMRTRMSMMTRPLMLGMQATTTKWPPAMTMHPWI